MPTREVACPHCGTLVWLGPCRQPWRVGVARSAQQWSMRLALWLAAVSIALVLVGIGWFAYAA
jgi:hypothetical protein